jgi:predicted CXXCH cytochrome family protein
MGIRSVFVVLGLLLVSGFLLFNYQYTRRQPSKDVTAADYVDSSECASCHASIYEKFQHSGMGRSFSRLGSVITEDFKLKNSFYHRASDRYYTMYERDGRYFQRRYQVGPDGEQINVVEKAIDYVLGSGNHARTYLHLDEQKKLVQLPVGWYAEKGGYWAMNPGFDRPDQPDFRRRISQECIFCHNAYPAVGNDADRTGGDASFPGKIPEGIDCQRCHGPGGAHIRATQSINSTADQIRKSIVNPARLSSDRNLEVCMQCHLESTSARLPYSLRRFDRGVFSYRPGEPLADYALHFEPVEGSEHKGRFEIVNQAYRLRQSACFQNSGGAMTCTMCHDPHNGARNEEATEHYVSVCQSCHEDAIKKLVAARRHPSSNDCVGCHMPSRRTDDVVHVVMTDHYIQRRKPSRDLLAPLAERTDDNDYRGEVVLYYPPSLPSSADSELYSAAAQVVQNSNLNDGITRLKAALEKYRPAEGEFYFVMAEAYSNTNEPDLAIPMYREALARRPDFWPALYRLGLSLAGVGQEQDGLEFLERARNFSSDERLLNALAMAYRRMGRLGEAAAVLKNAVPVNPDFPQTYINLGDILAQMGDIAGAQKAFDDAIRAQPDFIPPYTQRANLFIRAGNLQQAQYYLERAMTQAIPKDPALADVHNVLANLLANQGHTERALIHYLESLTINPSLAPAHFGLGQLLATQGKKADAIAHFQKVTEIGDAALSRAAAAAIRRLRQ